jgi:hypothetical protein
MLPIRPAALAFLPLVLLAAPGAASATVPSQVGDEELRFTVLKDGDEVGHHTLSIHPGADSTRVDVDTEVVVKVAFVAVYRFEHQGHETWKNGRLVSLSSKTHDDGIDHVLKVAAGPNDLEVTGDGSTHELPATTVPASLWNPATIHQGALMNTLDGHMMAVSVADLGQDTVEVHGQPTAAHHYALSGDLARELWYDAHGTLVRVRFRAKDDSEILYVLGD